MKNSKVNTKAANSDAVILKISDLKARTYVLKLEGYRCTHPLVMQ